MVVIFEHRKSGTRQLLYKTIYINPGGALPAKGACTQAKARAVVQQVVEALGECTPRTEPKCAPVKAQRALEL